MKSPDFCHKINEIENRFFVSFNNTKYNTISRNCDNKFNLMIITFIPVLRLIEKKTFEESNSVFGETFEAKFLETFI